MNWAAASRGAAASAASAHSSGGSSLRMDPFSWSRRLAQEDARAADLLGRDHAQEIGQEPVHQLEVRRQREDALLLRVQDLLGEALLVQEETGLGVDEIEVRPSPLSAPVLPGRDHAP